MTILATVPLRLWFEDDALTNDVLEKYVNVVKDPTQISTMPSLLPSDCDKKDLDEVPQGRHFNDSKDLQRIATSATQYTNIWSMTAKDKHFTNYETLDIASRTKEEGGSGGLRRYWLLVRNKSSKRSIFELKEAAKPGVEYGRTLRVLSMNDRLPVLKNLLFVQVSRMATLHSEHWNGVEKDALRIWLRESSDVLSKRWRSVYEKYH